MCLSACLLLVSYVTSEQNEHHIKSRDYAGISALVLTGYFPLLLSRLAFNEGIIKTHLSDFLFEGKECPGNRSKQTVAAVSHICQRSEKKN